MNNNEITKRLFRAIERGLVDSAKKAIKAGAKVNSTELEGTFLAIAARRGDYAMVELLLDSGADPLFYDSLWPNAVVSCCQKRNEPNLDVLKLLLSRGADPNESKGDALLNACFNKNIEIVKVLLNAGVNPNSTGYMYLSSPLHEVLHCEPPLGSMEIYNKSLAIPRKKRQVWFEEQVKILKQEYVRNMFEIIDLLIRSGADINNSRYNKVFNIHYDTPLHEAAKSECYDTMAFLIENGANPDIENDEEKTVRDIVISSFWEFYIDSKNIVDTAILSIEEPNKERKIIQMKADIYHAESIRFKANLYSLILDILYAQSKS